MINRIQKIISDLKVLRQDWERFRSVRHLRPGMVITFGAGVRSCRVVANNASGLVLDYENGSPAEFWSKRLPPGIQILSPDTRVGLLKES